ncbi:uncharacterized protein LOC111089312, partial [Limulus polyphemus]|uniref:Uncharacterized protein LOC111089312 n=1 Tax=Limulus polyphemus TaxID=6850 RepID=A0ABM1TN31_LIMPO
MLQINTEDSQTEGNVPSTGKRNPFDFFSNIFRRKGKDTEIYVRDRSEDPLAETERGSNPKNGTFLSDSIYQSTSQLLSSSRNRKHANVYTHCPVPHPEMETLCLSREDNPYIQEKLKKVGSDHDFPDTAFSSPPTLDKEKLINTDGTSEQEETGGSMHVHLIRSPPPGFPRNITEFVFSDKKYTPRHSPKKIRQPHDLHFPTETTSTAPRRRPSLPHGDDLHCLTETSFTGNRSKKHSSQKLGLRASSSSLPSLEVLQKRDTKRNLNPLFSKTGLNVIDPGIKKILLSQKQKLFSGNTHACVSNDRNCGKVVL